MLHVREQQRFHWCGHRPRERAGEAARDPVGRPDGPSKTPLFFGLVRGARLLEANSVLVIIIVVVGIVYLYIYRLSIKYPP